MPITYTSGEQVEVYRFNWLITLGVPATALFLQAWLPQLFPSFAILDLPLLVTRVFCVLNKVVYFMVARGLVNLNVQWNWPHELWSALLNAFVGVFMFFALDRFKQRT